MRIAALTLVAAALTAQCAAGCGPQVDRVPPAGASVRAQPPPTPASAPASRPSSAGARGSLERRDLPAIVRTLLRERMERHADAMESLLLSSLSLEYDLIAQRSDWVAAEPRISRPEPSDDGDLINQVLPPRFFDLQDELNRQAIALGDAARRHDDEGVARAYGQLAGTCIRCHGLYRRLPGAPPASAAR